MPEQMSPTGRTFQSLGFECSYESEIDPEFPGTGTWTEQIYEFTAEDNAQIFRSTWGTPYVIRVTPQKRTEAWVGFFESGGLGVEDGVFGTPDPDSVLLVANGLAYLVDVVTPDRYIRPSHSVVQVKGSPAHGILVLSSWSDLKIISREGDIAYSPRLCADDLQIEEISDHGIVCRGDFVGSIETMVVDALTGEVIEGPTFSWNIRPRRRLWPWRR